MDDEQDDNKNSPTVPWDPNAFKLSAANGGDSVFSFTTNSSQKQSSQSTAMKSNLPRFSFASPAASQSMDSVAARQGGGEKEAAAGSSSVPSSLGKRSKDDRASSNNNIEDVFEQSKSFLLILMMKDLIIHGLNSYPESNVNHHTIFSCSPFTIVTMKMKSLSTTNSNEEKVHIFISVLDINASSAEFFLESALWDLEAAVALYLESTGDNNRLITHGYNQWGNSDDGGKRSKRGPSNFQMPNRYRSREVVVLDLPEGWGAKVSKTLGTVYFVHLESGHTQNEVPPGFADLVEDHGGNSNSESLETGNGMMDEVGDSQSTQSQSFTGSAQTFDDVIGNPNEAPGVPSGGGDSGNNDGTEQDIRE